MVMEQSGLYEVIGEADTGQSGWQIIRDRVPDLVVMDLDIPTTSGLEVIERIRNEFPKMAVVVLSAQNESVYAARALRAGANGFVSKDRDLQILQMAFTSVSAGFSFFPGIPNDAGEEPTSASVPKLSNREVTVLRLLVKGTSHKVIGAQLCISDKTVSAYKMRILRKLGLSNIVDLVDFARSNRLLL